MLRVAWEKRSRCGGSARIFALKLPFNDKEIKSFLPGLMFVAERGFSWL